MISRASISLLAVISLALQCGLAFAFFKSMPTRVAVEKLYMGGGRSLEEKTMSKRQIFKNVRDKVIEASQVPGFLDVEGQTKEVELYCKSNKDGKQIGDCPYAQFVQLVMLRKGILYQTIPVLPSKKPDWLVKDHGGKLPAIVHKGNVVTESVAIAEYIEKSYPHNALSRQGALTYQEVIQKTAGFFPSLKEYIINKDAARDVELLAKVDAQLDIIDEILRSTPGYYLCGLEMNMADLYILPQLFHAVVAMDLFKGVEIYHIDGEFQRPALESFIKRMMKLDEFNSKRSYIGVDSIVYGWKVARGDLPAPV